MFSYLKTLRFCFYKVFVETLRVDTCLLPGMVYPAQNEKLVQKLKEKNITCFAMDAWRGFFLIWESSDLGRLPQYDTSFGSVDPSNDPS